MENGEKSVVGHCASRLRRDKNRDGDCDEPAVRLTETAMRLGQE